MAVKRLARADFARIKSGASRRFHGKYFTLSVTKASDNNASTEPRFACVVSKKAAKRAVDRNLIKRRAREAARDALKRAGAPASYVFYAKKEALGAPYRDIAADIRKLLATV